MLKKFISKIIKNIRLFNSVLINIFNNYIFAYIDRHTIHNDLGASFTSIVRDSKTIIKKASPDGEDKLADEISWYIKFKDSKMKKWLPEILDYSLKKRNVYYRMKYYNYPNLRKIIMYNGNAFFVLKLRWKKIFNIYNKYLFNKNNSSKPSKNFVHDCHLEKLKSRVQLIKKKAPYFNFLLKINKINVNGKVLLNYHLIINKIKKSNSIISKLTPDFLYHSHGDLHSNNILCGILPSTMILLDCRGKSPDGKEHFDPAYDIAKIFHDLRSFYSLIENQMYSLFFLEDKNNNIKVEYSFHQQEYKKRFLQNYDYVKDLINKKMSHLEGLEYRAEFIEAMLYLTMVPMHLKIKSEAMICWITGIERLNQWFEKYHSKEYKDLLKRTK